jgi:hypothetical protein
MRAGFGRGYTDLCARRAGLIPRLRSKSDKRFWIRLLGTEWNCHDAASKILKGGRCAASNHLQSRNRGSDDHGSPRGTSRVSRFLGRRTRNIDEAEDILQDFYLKAIRSARTIKEPGALKGWLAQVLRRTLIDYYRRASVRKTARQRLESAEGSAMLIDDDAERAVCNCLSTSAGDADRVFATYPASRSAGPAAQ